MKHVWIIQLFTNKEWQSVGCGVTKKEARMRMKAEWKKYSPKDRFRVVKYVSASP